MGARDDFALGVYQTYDAETVGSCIMDIRLATSLGQALSLYRASGVKGMLAKAHIHPGGWDNLAEAFNITSRFFHDSGDGMVALGSVYRGSETPKDLKRFAREARCYPITVHGYRPGQLTLAGV